MNHTHLKELQVQLTKLNAEAAEAEHDFQAVVNRREKLHREITDIKSQISRATAEAPIVSEHAILRFAERCGLIDVKAIVGEILTADTVQRIRQLGSGKYPIGHGLRAVVKNNVVVTVAGKGEL